MMRVITLMLAAAAGASLAAPPKPVPPKKLAELRNTSMIFADCVVARHYALARNMVTEDPNNAVILKKYSGLTDEDCMGDAIENTSSGGIRFSGDTFTFMIADALVRKDFARSGPTTFEKLAPLQREVPSAPDPLYFAKASEKKRQEAEDGYQRQKTWWSLSVFGECGARQSPEQIRALAQTVPQSVEEKAIMRKIAPQLGTCLDAGLIKFQPLQLRGTLVTNYYRLAASSLPPLVERR